MILIASEDPLIFFREIQGVFNAIELSYTQIENNYIYQINNKRDWVILGRKGMEITIQRVGSEYEELSFWRSFFTYKWTVNAQDQIGIRIRPGKEFSQPRFPLHIGFYGDGQLKLAYAVCGTEEIVKYNEHDFILYFHEYCEEGPDIWLFGFDREFTYELDLNIDITGTLIVLARDFRCATFSFTLSFGILGTTDQKRWPLYVVMALFLYVLGCELRINGLLGLDHVHNPHQHFTVIDILFLYCVGIGILYVIKEAFNLMRLLAQYIGKVLPLPFCKYSFIIVIFAYSLPWIIVIILTLTSYVAIVEKPQYKSLLLFSFLSLCLGLPQMLSWFIIFQDHKVIETLNPHDLVTISSYLFLLFTLVCSNRTLRIERELVVLGMYLGTCVYELLYRANLVMALFSLYFSIRLWMPAPLPKKLFHSKAI